MGLISKNVLQNGMRVALGCAMGASALLWPIKTPASDLVDAGVVFKGPSGLTVTTNDLQFYFSEWGVGVAPERASHPPNLEMAVEATYISKLLASRADDVFEGDDERDALYTQDKLNRKKMDQWLDYEVKVRLSELDWDSLAKEEYLANPQKYEQPEQLRASHILVETEGMRLLDAMLKVEEVRVKLLNGEEFDALAKTYSDSDSRLKGGDVGYFSRGKMVPDFEEAAFNLREVGDVSDLVVSQFGVHLIMLTERVAPTRAPFDLAKPYIIEELNQRYTQSIREELVDHERGAMLEGNYEFDRELIDRIRANPQLLAP